MPLDALSGKVDEYRQREVQHHQEAELISLDQKKIDALVSSAMSVDDSIISLFSDIQSDIQLDHSRLDAEATELEGEKQVLVNEIVEQVRINEEVKSKAELLSGQKYTGGIDKVSSKANEYISELKQMLEELDSNMSDSVSLSSETKSDSFAGMCNFNDGVVNRDTDKNIADISIFENTNEKQQMILSYADQWSKGLSNEEFNALKDYTREEPNYYRNINKKLRGKTAFFDSGNRERAFLIHNALKKSEIPCPCTVYRGGPPDILGKFKNMSDDELIGKVLLDKGFMSTSIVKGCEFGGNVKLEIFVPSGSKGAYLSNGISAIGEGEHEILFDKGCRLKIVGVAYDMWNNRVIQARMM